MNRVFHSVRFRLACWHSLVLAVLLVVFWVLLYQTVKYQGVHHHDDSLRAAARTVIAILEREPDCASLTAEQIDDLRRLNRLLLVHELAGQGQVFYRSPDVDPALFPEREKEFSEHLSQPESFQTLEEDEGALRVYSARYTSRAGRRGVIRVMDPLGNTEEFLSALRWALLLVLPVLLLLAGWGGYWLAGRALRPVDVVTRLAQEIGATNLSRRLPSPKTQDELGRLLDTFNQMIARLESSFETMHRFTSDASHELRTPLTIMRNTIDVALGCERTAEAHRQVLTDLLEEVERLSQLVEGLLLLARADAGSFEFERKPVRVHELSAEVTESLRPLAEADGVLLRWEHVEPVELLGDEKWLRQMLFNLVHNAIKYNRKPGSVRVSLRSRDGSAILSVHDTGHGIPEEEQPRLFERFHRRDKARSRDDGGAGLGLSIARWIARSHGGEITVQSRIGEGTTFFVSLPLMAC